MVECGLTWGMMVSLERRVPRPRLEMSLPSMASTPEAASLILEGLGGERWAHRNRERVSEDLPLPVLPTIPTWEGR